MNVPDRRWDVDTFELKPETERLVQEEIQRGHFRSIDELIVQGVNALRERAAIESSASDVRSRATDDVRKLAQRHSLTSYDAAYLELAWRKGLPLASLDAELKKRCLRLE